MNLKVSSRERSLLSLDSRNIQNETDPNFWVDFRTLEVLEWQSVRFEISNRARSVFGKRAAENLNPGWAPHFYDSKKTELNRSEASLQSQAVLELLDLRRESQLNLPLGDVPDLGNILVRIQRSASIVVSEFVDLVRFHKSAQGLYHFLNRYGTTKASLLKTLTGIQLAEEWSRKHFPLLDSQGQIVDSASEDLRALRSLSKELHEKIKNRLDDFLHNPRLAEVMQDFYITLRDGRYVVPIKTNFRGRVPGIVHDVSNSQSTLFIEPQEIVEWNNQLKVTEMEIEHEIERILSEVVKDSQPFLRAFETNVEIITRADFLLASSLWIEDWKRVATVAEDLTATGADSFLTFEGLYHPLLCLQREVVDNSLSWKGAFVLTGPNTGGKTVLLKSLGLSVLLARSGLPVPAQKATVPSDLRGVMADIGDDQSIEENLSTFSGHLKVLKGMLENTRPGDLVMVDEIATGTSPEEGQPLAQSVIEELLNRNLRVFVTTHYGGLKTFAMTDERCRIASMSFDKAHRKPTFKIQLDLPGDSSAFEIAEQMGLPSAVLNRARSLRGEMNEDVSLALSRLEKARLQLIEKEKQLEFAESKARERELKAQEKAKELDLKQREGLGEEAKSLLKSLSQLRDELSTSVRSATSVELGQGAKNLFSKISEVSDEIRGRVAEKSSQLGEDLELHDNQIVGDLWVEVDGFGVGRIVETPKDFSRGAKTPVLVLVGDLQVGVPRSKIKKLSREKERHAKTQKALTDTHKEKKLGAPVISSTAVRPSSAGSGSLLCDVRGKTVEEALRKVENSLNEIYRTEEEILVTIIHGHGSDRLKDAIRGYLKKERADLSYRTGSWPGEGGDGVTVVERAK